MFKISSVIFLAFWQLTAVPIVGAIAQNGNSHMVQSSTFAASDQGVSIAYRDI